MASDFTIDNLYKKKIDELTKYENNEIPKIEEKINNFLQEKSNLDENNIEDLKKIMSLDKNIMNLKNRINKIKSKKNKYLLDNSKELFDYFEIKQDIEKNKNPKKTINAFFNIKENNEPENKGNNKKSLNSCIQEYVRKNNFEYLNISDYFYDKNICEKCKEGELIKVNHDGILICNKCYANFKYLIDNDKPSYKEPPKEISFYAYKRINHFREILSQFQAKESTDIPVEIIEHIKSQIKKERIKLDNLTNKKTKEILKKLGYNKYYEHIPFIKDKLGIKPPIMTPHLEETLCNLFMDIQIPYAKYCPNDRVNFLNYYYTLYKLCELLGENQYLKYFPMLKDQKKIEQDDIWKKICNELGWSFIPTL